MTKCRFAAFLAFLGMGSAWGDAQQLSFQQPVSTAIQNGPVAMVTGDFNGDGKPDLAIANGGSSSISVFLGKGDSTFLPPTTYSVPSGCALGYLTTADFNRDRKLDLMAACTTGTSLLVFLGRGDGTLNAPVITTLPLFALVGNLIEGNFDGLTIADFNGDGIPDAVLLMTTDFSSTIDPAAYLLVGRGDGGFQTPSKMNLGNTSPLGVAAADFNGDGKPDLAVLAGNTANLGALNFASSETLTIELGDGKGSFTAGATYPWAGSILSLVVADVNGDGKADIVSDGPLLLGDGSISTSVLAVYLGKGDGTFQLPIATTQGSGTLPLAFGLADLRGIGKLDVVEGLWAIAGDNTLGSGSLVVKQGNGNGTFQSPITLQFPSGSLPLAVVAADFNGDGRADLALTEFSAAAFSNSGQGSSVSLSTILQAFALLPPGTLLTYANSTSVSALTFSNLNAASFTGNSVATNSIVSAFGAHIAATTVANSMVPIPTTLGGISINVKDALGATRAAPLFYVSPNQINYAIPDGTATGTATVSIVGNAAPFTTPQSIVSVAPGVFGQSGLAVGNVITAVNGVQTATSPVRLDALGNVVPVPIVLSSESQVVLILYGTGIRNHTSDVTATLGGLVLPVAYAGPTGQYAGEDQINIFLPPQLRGVGLVTVTLSVDGQTTNPLKIQIQ